MAKTIDLFEDSKDGMNLLGGRKGALGKAASATLTGLDNFLTYHGYEPTEPEVVSQTPERLSLGGKESPSRYSLGLSEFKPSTFEQSGESVAPKEASRKSVYEALDEEVLKGLPGFPTEFSEYAKTAGKTAKMEAEKTSEAAKMGKEELAKFQNLIGNSITLQNNIYTNWLETSEQAKKGIDEIQAKYPTLTRADILSNMSTGEKITTAVLTALGAVFSGKGEENPALKVLNRTMDESILQQSINYDREMKNLMQKKMINDDTFKVATENARSNFDMQKNNLDTALRIIDLSRSERSKDELQLVEDNATNMIKMQVATAKMNYDLQVFELKQQQSMFKAKMRLEEGRRTSYVQKLDVTTDSKIMKSDVTPVLLRQGLDLEKFNLGYNDRMKKINSESKIIEAIKSGIGVNSIDTLIKNHNAEFKTNLPLASHLPLRGDVREAEPAFYQILQVDKDDLNSYIDQSIVPPLGQ